MSDEEFKFDGAAIETPAFRDLLKFVEGAGRAEVDDAAAISKAVENCENGIPTAQRLCTCSKGKLCVIPSKFELLLNERRCALLVWANGSNADPIEFILVKNANDWLEILAQREQTYCV